MGPGAPGGPGGRKQSQRRQDKGQGWEGLRFRGREENQRMNTRAPPCCLWRPSVQGLPPHPGGGQETLEEAEGRRAEGATGPGATPAQRAVDAADPGPGAPLTLSPSSPAPPGGPAGARKPTGPCTPSRPVGPMGPFSPCGREEGRRRDPQMLLPWRPLEAQQLPDPPQCFPGTALTGTPFSPAAPGGPCGPRRPGRPVVPGSCEPRSPGDPCDRSKHQTR